MPGKLVVLEGPEGAGKTTVARTLAARLRERGIEVLEVREPGGTPLAEAARDLALSPHLEVTPVSELFLILAARADLVRRVIEPGLRQGKLVLCDRFDLSTRIYQMTVRELPRELVLAANRLATDGLEPDLTMILDLDAETGLLRGIEAGKTPDRLENEGNDFHRRVCQAYREVEGPGVEHLDASRSLDQVTETAWQLLEKYLGGTVDSRDGLNEKGSTAREESRT